jgi:hypothetical protein
MDEINLNFAIESSSCLWNKIFEGFDQDTVLTSRFEGNSQKSINLLYRFGSLLRKKHSDCIIEPRNYGIIIKRNVTENDEDEVNDWIRLMENLKNEMIRMNY